PAQRAAPGREHLPGRFGRGPREPAGAGVAAAVADRAVPRRPARLLPPGRRRGQEAARRVRAAVLPRHRLRAARLRLRRARRTWQQRARLRVDTGGDALLRAGGAAAAGGQRRLAAALELLRADVSALPPGAGPGGGAAAGGGGRLSRRRMKVTR